MFPGVVPGGWGCVREVARAGGQALLVQLRGTHKEEITGVEERQPLQRQFPGGSGSTGSRWRGSFYLGMNLPFLSVAPLDPRGAREG